jgi:hypothetical protein
VADCSKATEAKLQGRRRCASKRGINLPVRDQASNLDRQRRSHASITISSICFFAKQWHEAPCTVYTETNRIATAEENISGNISAYTLRGPTGYRIQRCVMDPLPRASNGHFPISPSLRIKMPVTFLLYAGVLYDRWVPSCALKILLHVHLFPLPLRGAGLYQSHCLGFTLPPSPFPYPAGQT